MIIEVYDLSDGNKTCFEAARGDRPGDLSRAGKAELAEYSFSDGADYRDDVNTGSMSVRLDYSWLDEHAAFATSRLEGSATPAKGIFNGRLLWDITDNFNITLWGKNLTDERYREYGIELFDSNGYALGIGNTPRTWGVDLSYRFGR